MSPWLDLLLNVIAFAGFRRITGRPRKATGHWTDNIASVVRLPAEGMRRGGVDGFLCPCPLGWNYFQLSERDIGDPVGSYRRA